MSALTENKAPEGKTMRKYHVVVINEKTGKKAYMTANPVTHSEGCTILSKLTKYEWRRNQLEEVADHD